MVQRKTQSAKYWQQLSLTPEEIRHLMEFVRQNGQPVTLADLALALVQHRCQLEELAVRTEFQRGTLYQPQSSYQLGEELVFPRFNFALGKVIGQRPGHHPRYGDFSVIRVDMGPRYGVREFAAELQHPHVLNVGDGQALTESEGLAPPAELYALYRDSIDPALSEALDDSPEFVSFRGKWFLKELLAPIHTGHLNIAEAAIEEKEQPLAPEAVLKELRDLDLPTDIPAEVQAFSLNVAMQADERFGMVGPKRQVLWYLRRLEPPDLTRVPRYLSAPKFSYDLGRLDGELIRLLSEIDDELTDGVGLAQPVTVPDMVTLVLTYPHRRAGSLPITPRTAPFFPEAEEEYVRITFVDRHSGQRMPGWVVSKHRYVTGLGPWYAQRKLPTGAYISLHRMDEPLTVGISYRPVREKREWIRGAVVQAGRLSFQNLRQPIACEYDDLMIIGEENPVALDGLWAGPEEQKKPLLPFLRQVALDLVKINPQRTVHAKTLYSAVNLVRRCPPAPIFHELSSHACFVPMGHGYWTYDPTKED